MINVNYTDRLKPDNKGLTTYLDEILCKNYQIPTFQREVVWEEENVKKLWDSIYKFYPLGSILIWKTNLKLQNHRQVNGHTISEKEFSRSEYQYILDGQQRTTSLLTSIHGGTIEGRDGFNPVIYVDLTIRLETETDDSSYRSRFLFWHEIDDKEGLIKQNVPRNKKFNEGLIVKLYDIKYNFESVERRLVTHSNTEYKEYDHPYRIELRRLRSIIDNYRISFIEVKGIHVAEVCQIFERINQSGRPLNIFDIVVAKTFVPCEQKQNGFYLRELIDNFRNESKSQFMAISDLDYLQILAVIINRNVPSSGVNNITDRYLNEIKTDHILSIWEDAKQAILKTFDFFENHLHIKSPNLVPFRYFYFTLSTYFFKNRRPNYDFLKKYFWFESLHFDDRLSNTTQLFNHIEFLNKEKQGQPYEFSRFLIDKEVFRSSSYSSKGRISRAILSLYANLQPRDWDHCDRYVNVENFFFSTDRPNLHHIFPINSDYVLNNKHVNRVDCNSLMNIAFITQITNLDITNRNPLEYLKDYDSLEFEDILKSHFLPKVILDWVRSGNMPINALDQFIEARLNLIIDDLKMRLSDIKIYEIDSNALNPTS